MLKEGQVRITNSEGYDHKTVFVVTNVEGNNADFIDQSGQVYHGIACRQIMEETSTLLAEYPTWKDAVNSVEFKTGTALSKVIYLVYNSYSSYNTVPVMAFTDEKDAEQYCHDNNCEFVSPICFNEGKE